MPMIASILKSEELALLKAVRALSDGQAHIVRKFIEHLSAKEPQAVKGAKPLAEETNVIRLPLPHRRRSRRSSDKRS